MSEEAARNKFREVFKEQYPEGHWQRFEDRFHAGIPDINVAIPGNGEWWVEAKYLKELPKWARTPIRVGIRREQAMWLDNRKRAGGQVLVLVRIGKLEWTAFDDHFEQLEEGIPSETFFQLAKWRGPQLDLPSLFSNGNSNC